MDFLRRFHIDNAAGGKLNAGFVHLLLNHRHFLRSDVHGKVHILQCDFLQTEAPGHFERLIECEGPKSIGRHSQSEGSRDTLGTLGFGKNGRKWERADSR